MTITLHLGVVDVPYAHNPELKPKQRKKRSASTMTTGDVADILEAKYHVMRIFFETHKADIAKDLESSLEGALENLLLGAPLGANAFAAAEGDVEKRFKDFLTNREMEGLGYPGVPTQAALDGVNHRLKHPYRKSNPRRPSFVDTGLYENSFRAWVD